MGNEAESTIPRIWLSPPHLAGTELAALGEVLASNWVAPAGPALAAFEEEVARLCGMPQALALNSGTAALHLALLLLGVGPGDEVVCSSLTFVGAVNPIRYLGAEPVFVDSEATTWNMDPEWLAICLEDRLARKQLPKAVVVTHLYGRCAAMPAIQAICSEYGIPLVEDAAEALGATLQGRMAGSWADMGFYSFNGNKVITTGGGGALVMRDAALKEQALYLATQARDTAPHYQHSAVGYNYRMSNVLAGLGLAQLVVLKERIEARRRNFAVYKARLGALPGFTFSEERTDAYDTCWLSTILIDPLLAGVDRAAVQAALAQENIESRPVWKPMHLQPLYEERPFYGSGLCTRVFETGLCLPSGSSLIEADLERICGVVEVNI